MSVLEHLITFRKQLIASGVIIALLCVPVIARSDTPIDKSADMEGSADPEFLQRFPYSWIVAFENPGKLVSHELVYGPLKKINRLLTPERSLITRGKITRITYRVPDGVRSGEVIKHYREEIAKQGEIMFFCQRRNCGSSMYWANDIFGQGMLYGPEEYQNLLVAGIPVGNQRYYVSVYAIQRGNQDGYVYLEIVKIADLKDQSSATLIEEFHSFGYLVIEDIDFAKSKDTLATTPQLSSIANLLQAHPALKVHIVARSRRGMNLALSLAESAQRANQVKDFLVTAGIAAERLTAHGLGILAPNSVGSYDRIVLVLNED